MKLDGKAALVTGAGTGIGRATAIQLAAQGCDVVVNYSRSKEAAELVVEKIVSSGGRAVAAQGDVSSDDDAKALVQTVIENFGRLDVLINNAAYTEHVAFADMDGLSDEIWQRTLAVNLMGPFKCIRAASEVMRQTTGPDGGEVVNISSMAGYLSTGSSLAYSTSKAALNHMTRILALTLAPNIRMNCIVPGFVDTPWTRTPAGDKYDHVEQIFASALPLRKVCSPDDLADAILGLITGSDLVTGQILPVDGGWTVMNPISLHATEL